MRHAKTTAFLLAVSVFLAGCGGSSGSTASGAGATAGGAGTGNAASAAGETASPDQGQNTDAKTPIPEENYSDREKQNLNALETRLAADSERLVKSGNYITNIYDDFVWKSEADIFPAKLDLSLQIKSQGNCSEPPAYCRTISAFPAKAAVNAS